MARVPYIEESEHPELAAEIAEVRKHRHGRLSHLYRTLLNSPPVATGWLTMLTSIRWRTKLPGAYRELAILRVALINDAPYEYKAHIPHALAEGITQQQIDALENWESASVFDENQRAVLAYTDTMTRNVKVPNDVFAGVRRMLDDQEIVELTATIGAYNLVSRFLVALEVGS